MPQAAGPHGHWFPWVVVPKTDDPNSCWPSWVVVPMATTPRAMVSWGLDNITLRPGPVETGSHSACGRIRPPTKLPRFLVLTQKDPCIFCVYVQAHWPGGETCPQDRGLPGVEDMRVPETRRPVFLEALSPARDSCVQMTPGKCVCPKSCTD